MARGWTVFMPMSLATLARVRLSPRRRFAKEHGSELSFSNISAELGDIKIALKA